jgi:hypothetical protein
MNFTGFRHQGFRAVGFTCLKRLGAVYYGMLANLDSGFHFLTKKGFRLEAYVSFKGVLV